MKRSVVTAKGQFVIPAELRRKYGIKKGTRISVSDRNGEIVLQPMTGKFFRSF
jgi:AbrB family looped-hinge helix DNA binding protein